MVHLLSFSIEVQRLEVPKCCLLTKIITLSRHNIEQWAWKVLYFTWIYRDVCFAREKMAFIHLLVFIGNT